MQRTTRRCTALAGVAMATLGLLTVAVTAASPAESISETASAAAAVSAVPADASPIVGLDARVGQRVPDISLPDLTGAPRSLTELRGQRAMLHVFASW